jgi:diguanylate cyclase (GGDEF)-like protein
MQIDLASIAALGALQAWLLAMVLLVTTHSYAGTAKISLRLRGWAMVMEATGWMLLSLREHMSSRPIGDGLMVVAANGIVIVAYALTVRALRMLLGVPQRQTLVVVCSVLCWLVASWFALAMPDYRARVLSASVIFLLDFYLLLSPLRGCLRRGGSIAERVMFSVLSFAALLQTWRILDLLFADAPAVNLLQLTTVNEVYVLLTATKPMFISIGFLLIYNEAMKADLKRLARIDPLTGVNNRLALAEKAGCLFDKAARSQRPFAALMLDADHFKRINDRFGHDGGDKVLLTLVDSIRASLGPHDVIGRVGGEEFVVLSPDMDVQSALALGEQIRLAVATAKLWIAGEAQMLTVSIGVTISLPDENDTEALLRRADLALYAAKRAGRNQVMAAEFCETSAEDLDTMLVT